MISQEERQRRLTQDKAIQAFAIAIQNSERVRAEKEARLVSDAKRVAARKLIREAEAERLALEEADDADTQYGHPGYEQRLAVESRQPGFSGTMSRPPPNHAFFNRWQRDSIWLDEQCRLQVLHNDNPELYSAVDMPPPRVPDRGRAQRSTIVARKGLSRREHRSRSQGGGSDRSIDRSQSRDRRPLPDDYGQMETDGYFDPNREPMDAEPPSWYHNGEPVAMEIDVSPVLRSTNGQQKPLRSQPVQPRAMFDRSVGNPVVDRSLLRSNVDGPVVPPTQAPRAVPPPPSYPPPPATQPRVPPPPSHPQPPHLAVFAAPVVVPASIPVVPLGPTAVPVRSKLERTSLAPMNAFAIRQEAMQQQLAVQARERLELDQMFKQIEESKELDTQAAIITAQQDEMAKDRLRLNVLLATQAQESRQREALREAHEAEMAQLRQQHQQLEQAREAALAAALKPMPAPAIPIPQETGPDVILIEPPNPHVEPTAPRIPMHLRLDRFSGVPNVTSTRFGAQGGNVAVTPDTGVTPIGRNMAMWETMASPHAGPVTLSSMHNSVWGRLSGRPDRSAWDLEPERAHYNDARSGDYDTFGYEPEEEEFARDDPVYRGRDEYQGMRPRGRRVNGRKEPEKCPHIFNGDPVEAQQYTERVVAFMTQTVSYNAETLRHMDAATVQQCLVAFSTGIIKGTSVPAKAFIADMDRQCPPEWKEASTGVHYMTVARNFCLYMTPVTCIEVAIKKLEALKCVDNEILAYNSEFTKLWKFIVNTQTLYPRHAIRGEQFFLETYLRGLSEKLCSLMLTSGVTDLVTLMTASAVAGQSLRAIGLLTPSRVAVAVNAVAAAVPPAACPACHASPWHQQKHCPWIRANPCSCGRPGHMQALCTRNGVPVPTPAPPAYQPHATPGHRGSHRGGHQSGRGGVAGRGVDRQQPYQGGGGGGNRHGGRGGSHGEVRGDRFHRRS